MKRIISLLLAVAICFSMAGCSSDKKAFEASKEAYNNIKSAYDIVTDFAVDYYEVWRAGIYEPQKIRDQGVTYLGSYLRNIDTEYLRKGLSRDAKKRMDNGGTILTDEHVNNPDLYLQMSTDKTLWSICPYAVIYAYDEAGKKSEAEELLNVAKQQMKEISEKYSDYEHYPNLKGFFSTTSSYLDACFNQAHSFEQFAELNKEYEKEASDYIADLDFIFSE